MLGFVLFVALTNAAVLPSSNSTAPASTDATTTITQTLPPTITRTSTLLSSTPSTTYTSYTRDPTWTWNFAQTWTVPIGSNPNDHTTAPPTTTPLSHLYPQNNGWSISRLPEVPFHGLASPYSNPFAQGGGHTNSDFELMGTCQTSFFESLTPWLQTAPITAITTLSQSTDSYIISAQTYPSQYSYVPQSTITSAGTAASVVWSAVFYTSTQTQTTVTDIYAPWTSYTYVTPFSYSVAEPCCWTCTLIGTNVQVNYWPTPSTVAPTPISTVVDDKGFTFVSPSIYVAFDTLYATNLCGRVGPNYKATTVAFGETELSTARAYRWDTAYKTDLPYYLNFARWERATWGDQASCVDVKSSFYQYSDYFDQYTDPADIVKAFHTVTSSLIHHYTVTYNVCSPLLSVPTELLALNTEWKDCSQGLNGLYDPPHPLKPASVLTTSADPTMTPGPTSPATQGPTIAPVTPTPTAEPITVPTTKPSDPPAPDPSIKPGDPPVQNPTTKPSNPPAQDPTTKPGDPPAQDPTTKPGDPPAQDPTTKLGDPPAQGPTSVQQSNGSPPASQKPPIQQTTSAAGVIIAGSSTIVAGPSSNYVIGTQTLVPGGQVTESGATYSLATNGASVVVDGSTVAITSTPVLASPTGYVLGSQTLAAGGPAITVSGTVISLAAGGSSVIMDGSTKPVASLLPQAPEYVVASQTLAPGGPAITVSGQEVSLQSGGSNVVVGSSTIPLSQYLGTTTTTAVPLGGIIATLGGFGAGSATSSSLQVSTGTYNGTSFNGGAVSEKRASLWAMVAVLGVGLMGMVAL